MMNATQTDKQQLANNLWTQIVELELEQARAGARGERPNATKYRALAADIAALRAERQQVLR